MRTRRYEPTLLPMRRAARTLGLGEHVFYAARDRGDLDCYVIGRRSYVRLSTARAWLEGHRRSPGAPEDGTPS